MENKAPHISIKGEPIFDILGFVVSNSLLTSLIVTALFFLIAVYYNAESKKAKKGAFFYVINEMLRALYNLYESQHS